MDTARRIVLFSTDWRSLISLLISVVTEAGFSHAGILTKAGFVDASENRGDVAITPDLKQFGSRKIIVFEVKAKDAWTRASADRWLQSQVGKKYDWKGVLGWFTSKKDVGSDKKWYCFELVIQYVLRSTGNPRYDRRVSAKTIMEQPGLTLKYYGRADQFEG